MVYCPPFHRSGSGTTHPLLPLRTRRCSPRDMLDCGVSVMRGTVLVIAIIMMMNVAARSSRMQRQVSTALGLRQRRFAVAKAGERRKADRKTHASRRISDNKYRFDVDSLTGNTDILDTGTNNEK